MKNRKEIVVYSHSALEPSVHVLRDQKVLPVLHDNID